MKRFTSLLALLVFLSMPFLHAQSVQISGMVTSSEDGMGIPGVSVVVQGTTIGAITDFDGKYSLAVPEGSATLVFSFVGMKTMEVAIEGRTTIDVVMEPDLLKVDEVVVTGYTSIRKSEVTGSSVQVGGEQLANMPVATIDQALQGKVSGVAISSSSGTPGAVQNIRIRGRSSITAGNEPLYVIDGVPMVNGNTSATTSGSSLSMLSSLNSSDIESMTVLKDASATAAYGARGANGVIVITTKSGQSGNAKINFSATYGVSNDATPGPEVLTGAERRELFYEALINTYGEAYEFNDQAGAQEFDDTYLGYYTDWNAAGSPETDWADIITNKNAPMREYNLSASGGKEGISYYASLGNFYQEATVIGSDFSRTSGALNLDVQLLPTVKFSSKNNASHSYQDGLLETSAYFSSPRTVKYFMPSTDRAYNDDGTIDYVNTSLPNPLWLAQEDIDDSKFTRILSNNTLTWDLPIENLKYSSRVNIDYQVYNYKRYRNPFRGDGDGETNGYGWQAHSNRVNYVIQNSFDYSIALAEVHKFDFKVLQEFQQNKYYYLSADGDNFATYGLTNLSSAGNPTSAYSEFTDWYIGSYLGMLHYSFDGKYIADVTYRKEGSSRFSPDNRWGNFWAVGAAWNLHKESFMAGMTSVVNNLKLRASYGVSGNANIGLNEYQAFLAYDANYAGTGAAYASTFGNTDLSWETNYSLDIGVDYGLFNNRIRGALGYYNRETRDMLLDVPLPPSTGFDAQQRNIGRMANKGIEAELEIDIIRGNDFNITVGGNVGTNANEVLELAKDPNGDDINITSTTTRVEVGQPVYAWYMPTWAGVDPDTGAELWYVNQEVDQTTTDNFNDAEQVFQGGSAIPTLTAGMNLHIDFKGVFMDINGYYAGGHKVYEEWHRYTHGTDLFPVGYYQGMAALLDRWQQPGDTGTRYGKFEYTTRPWQRHSKFLFDGDYFRIKDLTVGYDFDSNLTERVGIKGLRLYVRGTNLYTWVKDENLEWDPEVDVTGYTGLTTPPVKSFIFGINLNF